MMEYDHFVHACLQKIMAVGRQSYASATIDLLRAAASASLHRYVLEDKRQ